MDMILRQLDDNGILTLTLNRPEKLNALSFEVINNLEEHLEEARLSNAVKAILLTGQGKAFCAGADIKRLAMCDAQSGYEFARRGQEVFALLEHLGKPSLAAINGFAFGGGCELALAATFRIAANTALFGQPEVKLGIIPGFGGTQRLARLVGKGRAMDLCLTGRSIDAETANHWGLVSDVVAGDALIDRAKTILNDVLSKAPLAVASIMDAIHHGYDLPLAEALHLEAVHFAKVCASADKKEGVSAFLEKRDADFKGI